MEYQLMFEEYPQPIPWGEKYHVPLNVTEDVTRDEEGNEVHFHRADVVLKVEQPLSVDTIVAAAVLDVFGANASSAKTMGSLGDSNLKMSYEEFVAWITESAKAAGYK